MKYTQLGKTGLKVSRLGFGCMRLPMSAEGNVDRSLAIPLLRRAVDLGVNYFDTAIFYCHGDSQRVLGEAMEPIRDKVILSTKNHLHEGPVDAWQERLEESLRFLRTDCIDIYNLHGMSWDAWTRHISIDGPTGKRRLLERAKAAGKIRHICCSFHDSAEAMIKLAETGFFDSMTVQYNLLNQDLSKAIGRARELGVGVVVMGPVGGGRLGVDSARIRELTGGNVESTPEAALRFVLAHPGVNIALSGMSTTEMLDQNVKIVSEKEPFEKKQIDAISAELQRVREAEGIRCTACGYCQPCPFHIDIPGAFGVYNENKYYGLTDHSRAAYKGLFKNAAFCTECGSCMPKCPQKLDIPTLLRQVMAELDVEFGRYGSILSISSMKDGKASCRLTTKNLRPDPLRPMVEIDLKDGCKSKPARLELDAIDPLGSHVRQVQVSIPDGVGILEGTIATTDSEGQSLATAVYLPFLVIPQDKPHVHTAKLSAMDFSGRRDIADAHGYTVALRHDAERIYVDFDVRSQLHALARPGEAGGGRIELYIDLRPPEHGGGKPTYEDGTEQFFFSLGPTGYGSKSGKTYNLVHRNERTAQGVKVHIELPFAEFVKPDWHLPPVIGMDFMFVAHDSTGIEMGHPTYGGRQGLWQNPRLFTRAYLLGIERKPAGKGRGRLAGAEAK